MNTVLKKYYKINKGIVNSKEDKDSKFVNDLIVLEINNGIDKVLVMM